MDDSNDRIYKVYKHTSPSNKVYIGITKQKPELRWCNGNGYKYNIHFFRAIQKYGWDNFEHEIVCDCLTKDEAEQCEIDLIKEYNSTDKNFGYNIDLGGNLKPPMSDETKRKLSEANLGKKASEETRRKMSASLKGRVITKEHAQKISKALAGKKHPERCGENHHMYGKHHTDETKRKISESKTGKPGHPMSEELKEKLIEIWSKPIWQYSLDGDFIKEWESATKAGKVLEINSNDISSCCAGRIKTSGGFIWKYKGDELKNEDLWKHMYQPYQCRPIVQYSLKGEFICRYDSIIEAERNNESFKSSNICLCCSGETKTAYGYIWLYEGDELVLSDHVNKAKRQVIKLSLDEKFIEAYDSITEASKATGVDGGSITKCCRNQLKKAGGYIWRYADEYNETLQSTAA